MENRSDLSFGDNVRIRSTPETQSHAIAGLRGQIYGETTPSVTGIPVIGELLSDYAMNVQFEDRKESVWITPQLVEFIDHGAGTEITLEGVGQRSGCEARRASGSRGTQTNRGGNFGDSTI